jgi:hypothetical protein
MRKFPVGAAVSRRAPVAIRTLAPGPGAVLLLVVALVLSSAVPVTAAGRIEFKRIIGISWATFEDPPNPVAIPEAGFSLANQMGLNFGGGGVLPLSKLFSLDLNLQYIRKGTKVEHTLMADHVGTSTYNFRSLSVPLCVRVGPLKYHGVTPYGLAGLEASYLISHDVTYYPNGSSTGTAQKLGSMVKHFDFSAILGGGLDINFKTWTLFAEMRWYSGLVNLSNGIEGYPVIKTRTMSLQFGIRTHRKPFPL